MEKLLTPEQAWQDFLQHVFPGIQDRKSRLDIHRAVSHSRRGLLGHGRIKRILTGYAPDRYRFEERVILIEP